MFSTYKVLNWTLIVAMFPVKHWNLVAKEGARAFLTAVSPTWPSPSEPSGLLLLAGQALALLRGGPLRLSPRASGRLPLPPGGLQRGVADGIPTFPRKAARTRRTSGCPEKGKQKGLSQNYQKETAWRSKAGICSQDTRLPWALCSHPSGPYLDLSDN